MPNQSAPTSSPDFDALAWRCIGPSRGGRVVAVAGDPDNFATFYFGACAGGVWKTTDGGAYWRCVTDGFLTSASIGALAVSIADSNVVYAGTGETTIRLDVSYGDGMYRSTDAGATWRAIGLRETKHIGRICVHPQDPDLVYVAALGDIFGPHAERGVYRSRDGGESWDSILFRDADTGAIDLAMDASNPRILFAAMWQTRRNFWNISSGGPGSGLFRSVDGGDSWEEISRAPGLPLGPLGKIGVAVSPARAGRVWALIETEADKTGLYRSDDYGARWIFVCANRDLMHRPWYYTHVFADPKHGETVYISNLALWKSTDGGATYTEIKTPHGDNHDLWIDPANPERMVEGNDGGACVTFNGGYTWSSIYNQKTAQLYRIDVDSRYPYNVYGTQQDNTSIATPSSAVWGAITLGDCFYPGTGESGFIAVNPADNNIVYCGAIGSSPGGAGPLQRWDARTQQIQLVNVWPEESTGVAPRDMKYRFAWTYPIVFSPHDSDILYAGGNHVFRTRDEGANWEEISPDLSLDDESRQGHSGGDITRESAGAEVHATCACIVESPHRRGEIWASTDDGLVHVTRDDGQSWQNVTPQEMPALAYVGCVDISPHDADTIYVSATCYKLSDYKPYLFRSNDGGKSWQSIKGDLPADEITRVVREDPVRQGLLFTGTETGVFVSFDDGAHWSRMAGGLPVVPVYDLKIKGSDLVAGTHGRSFWILDDISPLRSLADGDRGTRLVAPRTTVREKLHYGALRGVGTGVSFSIASGINGGVRGYTRPDGTPAREFLDVGENPPNGVMVYYRLDTDSGPVTLTFRDRLGHDIIGFCSDDGTLPLGQRPTTTPGLNRFVWDMRHPAPTRLDESLNTARIKPLSKEPDATAGPHTVPGDYHVALEAGGATQVEGFTITKDPRLSVGQDAFEQQFALLQELMGCLGRLNAAVNRIRRLRQQLALLAGRFGEQHRDLGESMEALSGQLVAIEGKLVDIHRVSARDTLRNPAGLNDTLIDLINVVAIADIAPTRPAREVSRETIARVEAQLGELDAVIGKDVAQINELAKTHAIALVGA